MRRFRILACARRTVAGRAVPHHAGRLRRRAGLRNSSASRARPLVWRALLGAGARYGIQPFGVEAQRVLRLEKGHLIVGQDTDGLTDALEIECRWAVKMDKPFFIGQRSLRILEGQPRRQTLVGFTRRRRRRLPKECHLVLDGDDRRPRHQRGLFADARAASALRW